MVNTLEFSSRLQQIINYYDENASSFAEKIGVQRSSISHVLSGRNKPSLDFVMKVTNAYPEVNLYWLLNGEGVFPKQSTLKPKKTTPDRPIDLPSKGMTKDIDRVVIFFKDGSFKSYE